ncbi:hypothetical protein EFR45_08260 [Lactobacillus crispatus]|uniref:Uncharacterized protein n=1 Tax=Lactobacillus crispatus TaxID=47770 RepID=A0A6A1Z6A5_9LACO|nr:hypothetical protein F8251_05690 [Lactobacillus crispatus]MCT3538869.1 hypothetical protein [Lactobacillus crispatus]
MSLTLIHILQRLDFAIICDCAICCDGWNDYLCINFDHYVFLRWH